MRFTIIALLLPLAFIAGAVFLQIFLSKRQNKWLGLILPAISFIISLLFVLNMAAFSSFKTAKSVVLEDGQVIEQIVEEGSSEAIDFGPIIYVFLLANIPTLVLLGIYFACRERNKRNKEIDRMNIQDLE